MKRPSPQPLLLVSLLALFFALAACAVPATRYLSAGPTEPGNDNDPSTAVILLRPFTETFASDSQIGHHLFTRNRQTKLLVKPDTISQTLDAMLLHELATKKIATAHNGITWDQSPEGLASFTKPTRLIISGQITHLSLNVDEKVLSGKARVEMDVECILGVVKDKKVIHRNVHVAQEMVTISFGQKDLDKLLADCLKEASKEILAKCSDLVASMPLGPAQQPKTTNKTEQKIKTVNERTS
ncbi:MAG: hypothetical protein OEL55_03735 [Desulfobulbaceae bacterium]|nr:hypothetical protein [Desulfobulbaceae bacterium]